MEEMDHDKLHETVDDEHELLMREVFQGDAELYMLHHYLTDLCRPNEI